MTGPVPQTGKIMSKKRLTSENGRPIADNQNIQTAGVRGPVVFQDPWYLEKIARFDREVIPERRMHAKGSGAFGTFTVTHDITDYTRASVFAGSARKRSVWSASRPSRANAVPPTPSATSAGSPSGSTPTPATGIWWATTRRSSSCATRSSSPT